MTPSLDFPRRRRSGPPSLLAIAGALVWGAVELVALARSRRALKTGTDHA